MSYSFTVRAATKAEVLEKVDHELAAVVRNQQPHEADHLQAAAAAKAFVDLLADDLSYDVQCSVNGSLWSQGGVVKSASVNVQSSLMPKVE